VSICKRLKKIVRIEIFLKVFLSRIITSSMHKINLNGITSSNNLRRYLIMQFYNSLININASSFYFFTDLNVCASNSCLNGGTCTDVVNGYTCACASGYTGIHCETGMTQWTVPQLSIMIIYNSTWSILIQRIRNIWTVPQLSIMIIYNSTLSILIQ